MAIIAINTDTAQAFLSLKAELSGFAELLSSPKKWAAASTELETAKKTIQEAAVALTTIREADISLAKIAKAQAEADKSLAGATQALRELEVAKADAETTISKAEGIRSEQAEQVKFLDKRAKELNTFETDLGKLDESKKTAIKNAKDKSIELQEAIDKFNGEVVKLQSVKV